MIDLPPDPEDQWYEDLEDLARLIEVVLERHQEGVPSKILNRAILNFIKELAAKCPP